MNKYMQYLWNLSVFYGGRRSIKRKTGKSAVLVICRQPMGDTVLASPLIRGVRKIYPEHHIVLVTSKENYNLLECCPYADEVLTYDSRVDGNYLRGHRKKALSFAEEHFGQWDYDLAVIPSTGMPSMPEAWLAYFSGAKRRLSYSERYHPAMHDEFMGSYDKYFTDVLYDENIRHEVERNMSLLELLQTGIADDRLELWTDEADREYVRALWREMGISERGTRIVVNLKTSDPARDWPVERYAEVCRRLQKQVGRNIYFLLTGAGSKAAEYGGFFRQVLPEAYDLIDKTTVRQLVEVLRSADFYLGGDTGSMHLAAACHLRGVAVFRSACDLQNKLYMDALLRYPWQADITCLQPKHALKGCENGCFVGKPHCILQVEIDNVYQAMKEQIQEMEGREQK